VILGHGPTKGNQLVIVSENPSESVGNNVTHSYIVLENSRTYENDQWETLTFSPGGGLTGTVANMPSGCIASTQTSVSATTTITRLLPLYNGLVTVSAGTSSGTTDATINIAQVADQSNAGALPNTTIYKAQTDSNGNLYASNVALPATQCEVFLTNNNAAAKTVSLSVIQQKQLVAA
jgi:hypothetical protein